MGLKWELAERRADEDCVWIHWMFKGVNGSGHLAYPVRLSLYHDGVFGVEFPLDYRTDYQHSPMRVAAGGADLEMLLAYIEEAVKVYLDKAFENKVKVNKARTVALGFGLPDPAGAR